MKLKLIMNELGLLRTEDGNWGIRQINEEAWVVQHRWNSNDPWDWNILTTKNSKMLAIQYLHEEIQKGYNESV